MPDLQEMAFDVQTANVSLVTTAETVAISSPRIVVPRQTVNVGIIGFGMLTTGADTTTVTTRIRRGTTTSGDQVGEGATQQIKAAAGSTEPFLTMMMEERANVAELEYSFTLAQGSATGNGTLIHAAIYVLVF